MDSETRTFEHFWQQRGDLLLTPEAAAKDAWQKAYKAGRLARQSEDAAGKNETTIR